MISSFPTMPSDAMKSIENLKMVSPEILQARNIADLGLIDSRIRLLPDYVWGM